MNTCVIDIKKWRLGKKFFSIILIGFLTFPFPLFCRAEEEISPSPVPTVEESQQGGSPQQTNEVPPSPEPSGVVPTSEVSPPPAISPEAVEVGPSPDPSPSEAPSVMEESAPSSSSTEEEVKISPPLMLEEEINSATVSSTQNSISETGDNKTISSVLGVANITTGNATAVVEGVTIVNGDATNSQIAVPVVVVNGDSGIQNIDLSALWNEVQNNSGTCTSTPVVLLQQGDVTIEANASASTGGNVIIMPLGNAAIQTGNATAVIQLVTFVNSNILSSSTLFAFIVINGDYNGDIIVPNLERFYESLSEIPHLPLPANTNNQAVVDSQITSSAITGNNTQTINGGDATLTTGNAVSYASNTTYVNSTFASVYDYQVGIENFGTWNGSIVGWDTLPTSSNSECVSEDAAFSSSDAHVFVQANATSDTGNNGTTSVGSAMKTGIAFAATRVVNFINSTIVNSKIFQPVITVLGTWNGNLVVARPDLTIRLSESKKTVHRGEELIYTLTFENIGHDDARNVMVNVSFPQEERLTQGNATYTLAHLPAGASESFALKSTVGTDTKNGTSLLTSAEIKTSDSELNLANNTMSVAHLVEDAPSNDSDTSGANYTDTRLPNLSLSISHNVGTHVLPNDVITYDASITNNGEGTSLNTHLYQDIVDEAGNLLAAESFPFSEVTPHAKKEMTFGLQIPNEIPSGNYVARFVADSYSRSGELVESNTVSLPFQIGGEAAKVKTDGSVLGANTKTNNKRVEQKKPLNNSSVEPEFITSFILFSLFLFLIQAYFKHDSIRGLEQDVFEQILRIDPSPADKAAKA